MLKLPDWFAARLFGRRLAALVYDCLLLFAVLLFVSLPLTLLSGGAIHSGTAAYQLYLLAVSFLYLGWQWTRGGQTLGMKAWRLQLITAAGTTPDWSQAALRFAAALFSTAAFGLGFIWMLIDQDGLTWHDRWSGTRIRFVGTRVADS